MLGSKLIHVSKMEPGVYWLISVLHGRFQIKFNVSGGIWFYPMLRADSRFWLVNNREIWRRISRLTSSAWDIKTKERHLWRHNGDSDRRPLSLPPRYDLVTLCLYRFRPDWCDSWDFKAAEMFQNVTNIVWAWDKFVTPCLLPRIREFIHT